MFKESRQPPVALASFKIAERPSSLLQLRSVVVLGT